MSNRAGFDTPKDGVRPLRENRTLERLLKQYVIRIGENLVPLSHMVCRLIRIIELHGEASRVTEFEIASRGMGFGNA